MSHCTSAFICVQLSRALMITAVMMCDRNTWFHHSMARALDHHMQHRTSILAAFVVHGMNESVPSECPSRPFGVHRIPHTLFHIAKIGGHCPAASIHAHALTDADQGRIQGRGIHTSGAVFLSNMPRSRACGESWEQKLEWNESCVILNYHISYKLP